MNMNEDMRGFSRDMETRLDKVYKQGAGKKYGYDSITTLSSREDDEDFKKEEKGIAKIQS
jgi:hypothetical protein